MTAKLLLFLGLFTVTAAVAVQPLPPVRLPAQPPEKAAEKIGEQPVQVLRVNAQHETSFVVYPGDCNHLGTLFGGKTLAEMDRAAGVTVRRFLYSSPAGARDAVTVGVDGVKFHAPAQVKDLVFVTGRVGKLGDKSVAVNVAVERELPTGRELLAEGVFTFVAYDAQAKKAVEHGIMLLPKKGQP